MRYIFLKKISVRADFGHDIKYLLLRKISNENEIEAINLLPCLLEIAPDSSESCSVVEHRGGVCEKV